MFRAPLRSLGRAPLSPRARFAADRSWCVEALEARALLSLEGNMLFPADSPWNRPIASAPLAANSSTLVSNIGATGNVHPDFGTIYEGAYIGIPFNVVSAGQPTTNVVIDAYADESDLVPVPIPKGVAFDDRAGRKGG